MKCVINFLQLIEKISDFFDNKNAKAELYNLGNSAITVKVIKTKSINQDHTIQDFENIDDTTIKNILTNVIDQKNSVKVKIKKRIFLLSLI